MYKYSKITVIVVIIFLSNIIGIPVPIGSIQNLCHLYLLIRGRFGCVICACNTSQNPKTDLTLKKTRRQIHMQ